MKRTKILLVVFFFTAFLFQHLQNRPTVSSAAQLSPGQLTSFASSILYPQLYVYMYRLVPPTLPGSGSKQEPLTLCSYPEDVAAGVYGCGHEYPFDLNLQEPAGFFHVSEQYYLRNVIPDEMDFAELLPDAEALRAQAIASRTVASWKSAHQPEIGGFHVIDNSTQFQVFVPGASNSYPAYDAELDAAISATQNQYLSAGDGHTIDAEFSADMAGSSIDGGQSYLMPVPDPISTCGLQPHGNGWGMSQRGSIRWAKGNACPDGSGAAWPVKWNHQQILAHYYTGIDFMDDATGMKIAPDDRWNLLLHDVPVDYTVGPNTALGPFNITVQNTSTANWSTDELEVMYRWDARAWDGTGIFVPAALKGEAKQFPVSNITSLSDGGEILHLDLQRVGGTPRWRLVSRPAPLTDRRSPLATATRRGSHPLYHRIFVTHGRPFP